MLRSMWHQARLIQIQFQLMAELQIQFLSCMKGQSVTVDALSVLIVKGYTKVQCLLFGLVAASEYDVHNEDHWKQLEPLVPLLDKAWMVPAHVPLIQDLTNFEFQFLQFQFHTDSYSSFSFFNFSFILQFQFLQFQFHTPVSVSSISVSYSRSSFQILKYFNCLFSISFTVSH